jgi:hypothetical protein
MDTGKFNNPHVHLDAIRFGKDFEPENPVLQGFAQGEGWI